MLHNLRIIFLFFAFPFIVGKNLALLWLPIKNYLLALNFWYYIMHTYVLSYDMRVRYEHKDYKLIEIEAFLY